MADPIPDMLQRLDPGQMRILLRQLKEELGAISPDSPLHAHHSVRIAAIEAHLRNSPCDSSLGRSEQSSDHQPDPLAVDRLRRNAIVACLLVLFVFGTWIAFRLLPAPPPAPAPVELIEFDPNHPETPAVTPGFPWERLLLASAIAAGTLAVLAILAFSFAIWRMRVRSSLPKTQSRRSTLAWKYFKPTKEAVGTGIRWTVGAVVGLAILSGVYNLFNKGIDAAKELAKRPVVSQQKTTAISEWSLIAPVGKKVAVTTPLGWETNWHVEEPEPVNIFVYADGVKYHLKPGDPPLKIHKAKVLEFESGEKRPIKIRISQTKLYDNTFVVIAPVGRWSEEIDVRGKVFRTTPNGKTKILFVLLDKKTGRWTEREIIDAPGQSDSLGVASFASMKFQSLEENSVTVEVQLKPTIHR